MRGPGKNVLFSKWEHVPSIFIVLGFLAVILNTVKAPAEILFLASDVALIVISF